MSNVVNLRQFRKQKARSEKEAAAENNRKQHAVSSKLRKQAQKQNKTEADRLSGKSIRPEQKPDVPE